MPKLPEMNSHDRGIGFCKIFFLIVALNAGKKGQFRLSLHLIHGIRDFERRFPFLGQ